MGSRFLQYRRRGRQVPTEECGFTGLPGREDNDITSEFDAIDEIGEFLSARDDVIIFRIHGSVCAKCSHFFNRGYNRSHTFFKG